jgi:hypothetical protein
MTLQRQVVSVPIGSGQADDKARALVEGNELASNIRFPRTGIAGKSYSMDLKPSTGLPGSTGQIISVTEADGTTVAKTTKGTFTFDTVSALWRETNENAPIPSATLVDPLVRGGDDVFNVDIAIVADVMCVVYAKAARDGTGALTSIGTYATFFDVADGALRIISGPTLVTGFVQGRAYVLGVETGSSTRRFTIVGQTQSNRIGFADYTLSSGTYTFGSAADFTGTYASGAKFGCTVNGGDVYVVFPTGASTSILHLKSDSGNASLVDASYALTTVFYDASAGRVICANLTPTVRLCLDDLSGAFGSWSTSGWAVTAPTRVELARWDSTRIAVLMSADAPGALFGTSTQVWGTEVHVFETNGTFAYKFHLANTFIFGAPRYIDSWGESAYVLRAGIEPRTGRIVRMGDNAGGTAAIVRVACAFSSSVYEDNFVSSYKIGQSHTCVDSSGALFFGYHVATGPTAEQFGPLLSDGDTRVDLVRSQVAAPPPTRTVSANSTRLFGDGAGVSMAGSNFSAMLTLSRGDAPIITDIVTTGLGSNTLATASEVFIRFAWVWVDQYGNEHRGAPTPYVSDANPLGNGGCLSSAFVGTAPSPYSRLVAVPLPPLAEMVLYQERGVDLYLDVFQAAYDNPEAEALTARLKPTRSTDWLDCVLVYFTRGQGVDLNPEYNVTPFSVYVATLNAGPLPWFATELETSAPPAVLDITSTQNRLWALSAEKRNTVLPSKPIQPTVAPEFATELEFIVPSEGGDCVGIAAIDDKIVVFKQRRIFIVSGSPGDALGEGSTLQSPQMLSGDVGCVSAQSIVEGPFGVAFQSQRGFYTLDRSLALRFIGDKVQTATTGRFCGVLVPDQSEVRWLGATSAWLGSWAATGGMVVWDFLRDQWSTRQCADTTHHAVIGDSVVGAAGTVVSEEARTDWSNATHAQSIQTAWFKVSGVEGFQRVWRSVFLLYHFTGHLKIEVFHDYDSSFATSTHTWLESELAALSSSNGRVEVSLRPAQQKCATIQFRISEFTSFGDGGSNPVASFGRGFELVSVDLEVGAKSGTARRAHSASAKR